MTIPEAAARAALGSQLTARPKTSDSPVECIPMLRVTRRSAVKARTQAANRPGSLVATAPEPVRYQLPDLHTRAQTNLCAALRPRTATTTTAYAKRALRHLARRYQTLDTEISQIAREHTQRRQVLESLPALAGVASCGLAQFGILSLCQVFERTRCVGTVGTPHP